MRCAVDLTNARAVPMILPDGEGNSIELAPGQTKTVFGHYEYFRKIPVQGVTGLVVKKSKAKIPLVEKAQKKDVKLVDVTNHRQIPMSLALGVNAQHADLAPGETKRVVGRVSIMKQMGGISVREVKPPPPAPGPRPPAPPETPPKALAKAAAVKAAAAKAAAVKAAAVQASAERAAVARAEEAKVAAEKAATEKTVAAAAAAARAKTEADDAAMEAQAARDAAEKAAEAPEEPTPAEVEEVLEGVIFDPVKREALGLPDTKDEWERRGERYPYRELCAIARELDVKGRGRATLVEKIGGFVYGE